MTREDIIRMARESGFIINDENAMTHSLERFAALVASAERERIIAANAPEIEAVNAHIKALEDAVASNKEALSQQEPVIDKSAATRIATSLGWTPHRNPLTDEEIDKITEQLDETTIGWSTHEFARAIEAAHGIKENNT